MKEEGEVEEEIVLTHLYAEVRRSVRYVSTISGIRHLTYFPYDVLKGVGTQFRKVTKKREDTDTEEPSQPAES